MSTLHPITMNYVIAASILFRLTFVSADCNTVPVIANTNNNAKGTGPWTSGTVVRFECKLGYNPAGTGKEYQCSGNTWINGNLRCEQIYCRYIDPPENGRVVLKPTYKVGSSINFECNAGYDMQGNNVMSCLTDGTWGRRQPPTCQIKMCNDFGSIQHGTTFQDSSVGVRDGYGSIVKVECKSGYVINGSPTVMCQSNGNWDTRPTCLVSTCLPYPGLKSSCILHTRFTGSILLMMCMSNSTEISVTKTGPDSVDCYKEQWDDNDEIMACYCDCKINADVKLVSLKNVNKDGFLKHTHTLDWSCNNGASKQSTQPLVCTDGKIDTPTCISQTPVTDAMESTVYPPRTMESTVYPPRTMESTVYPPRTMESTVYPPRTTVKLPSTSSPVALIATSVVLVLLAVSGITAFCLWKKNVCQENKAVGPGAEYKRVPVNVHCGDAEEHKVAPTTGAKRNSNDEENNVAPTTGVVRDGNAEENNVAPTTGVVRGGNADENKVAPTIGVVRGGNAEENNVAPTTGVVRGGNADENKVAPTTSVVRGGNDDENKVAPTTGVVRGGNAEENNVAPTTGVVRGGNTDGNNVAPTTGVVRGGNADENKVAPTTGVVRGGNAEENNVAPTTGADSDGNDDNKIVAITMANDVVGDGDSEKKEVAPTTGADSDGNGDNKTVVITMDVDGDGDSEKKKVAVSTGADSDGKGDPM